MIDIFNKRWHGIKAEALGEPGKYEMVVIRVQTMDKGHWQTLTVPELEQLLVEHNKAVHKAEKLKGPYKADPIGKVVREAVKPKKKVKK